MYCGATAKLSTNAWMIPGAKAAPAPNADSAIPVASLFDKKNGLDFEPQSCTHATNETTTSQQISPPSIREPLHSTSHWC
jgi:hypothetical protein